MNRKYLYVRNDYRKRDITIVSDLLDRGDTFVVNFAWTFRSNKEEQFIKKVGRKIAVERLESNDPTYSDFVEIPKDEVNFYNIAYAVLVKIWENQATPIKFLEDLEEDARYFKFCSENGREKMSWEDLGV